MINPEAKTKNGFTLIEVLLVIAILAILASIVVIAINPSKQLRQARNAQRQSDVYTIMNALHQYAADHDGTFPTGVASSSKEVCKTGASSCTGLADLSALTDNESYLVSWPQDPLCGTDDDPCNANGTGYFVNGTGYGHVTVSADFAEDATVTITR